MGSQMASRWLPLTHFKRVQRACKEQSHFNFGNGGSTATFLFSTTTMIIGRCGYAMRGADTGGHMARERGRLRANHQDGVLG